jgi:hypothetical protein
MAVILVTASFERDTFMAEDVMVNTWHCTTANPTDPDRENAVYDFIGALQNFYTAVEDCLPTSLTGYVGIKAYDLVEPPTRVPFIDYSFNVAPNGGTFPGEVACCFSFKSDVVSGQVAARHKNRVFLPYGSSEITIVTGGVRPATTMLNTIASAGTDFISASQAAADWNWVTFSPTLAGYNPGTGLYADPPAGQFPVTSGWIDNALDTRRSRGLAPTQKTTFS